MWAMESAIKDAEVMYKQYIINTATIKVILEAYHVLDNTLRCQPDLLRSYLLECHWSLVQMYKSEKPDCDVEDVMKFINYPPTSVPDLTFVYRQYCLETIQILVREAPC